MPEAGVADASFATQLRSVRERAGLTQEELADRAGLTAHAVSALERGVRTHPYPHTVRSLALALAMSAAEQDALVASIPRRRGPAARRPGPRPDAAPNAPADLGVPPTQLFGREGDVTALAGLVRSGRVRLLTLTGMGGVGKTRLVAALAAELAEGFPDGVVQVPLASVAGAGSVLDTIRRSLGLPGADGPDTFDVVVADLRSRRLLLVLDNLEHLLGAAADLGRLIASCPTLTVLTSSRAPLRVRGEHEYPVGPLGLPPSGATTAAELTRAPAGALVLDRARAVGAQLVLTPEAVRDLAALCVRLAGIPLALELAAVRLRLLTPRALLERLDSVLDSGSGARDLPPRQRTMRSTLDWSYGLLSPDQRQLFRVLAVFRGGASLEAVEQVAAAATGLPAAEVLELLEQLVEHSMVVPRSGPEGSHRCTLLEPVAQYARTLLVGAEAERAERAHAEVYRQLALAGSTGIERDDQVLWLDRIEADEANLLVAVQRSLAGGYPDVGGRIVWKLWLYWWLRGQFTRGREQAELCLSATLSPPVRARVNLAAACMAYAGGDVPACTAYWAEGLRIGEQLQDREVVCKGVSGTGLAALAAGDVVTAEARFRRALPLCAGAGEAGVWMSSLAHVWLGTVLMLRGDLAGAAPEFGHGLQIARSRGDRLAVYVALYNLAQAAIAAGDHEQARVHLEEGIGLSEQTSDLSNLAYFLDALAVVESAAGAHEQVAVLLGAAQVLRESGGSVYAYYVPDEAVRAAAEREARAVLGADAFGDALARGLSSDLSTAVRVALRRGQPAGPGQGPSSPSQSS